MLTPHPEKCEEGVSVNKLLLLVFIRVLISQGCGSPGLRQKAKGWVYDSPAGFVMSNVPEWTAVLTSAQFFSCDDTQKVHKLKIYADIMQASVKTKHKQIYFYMLQSLHAIMYKNYNLASTNILYDRTANQMNCVSHAIVNWEEIVHLKAHTNQCRHVHFSKYNKKCAKSNKKDSKFRQPDSHCAFTMQLCTNPI